MERPCPNDGVSWVIAEDQSEAIAFLSRPESYGGHATAVERIETHGAVVFLVGDRAYKLKRAVRFSYLDYSTAALRRRFCEAELALNRRTAPALYLGLKSLNRSAGGTLAFDGDGPAVDFVVVMRRFDQADLFDRLAERGALTPPLMLELAETIARFHADSPPILDIGGSDGLAEVLASNGQNLALADETIFDPADIARVDGASRAMLHDRSALLDDRRRTGRVRHCHGDLHLRNICLIDGRPTLFDCIEFSRSLACIDLLYDLAFLLMDLRYRRLGDLANGVLNRYLDVGDESPEGLATLPLFLSARAAIRAHIAATAAGQQSAGQQLDGGAGRRLGDEARSYLSMAEELLRPAPPMLVAIGGLSGTGKSTLAYGLAPELGPAPGARVLRSDVLRKRLIGMPMATTLPDAAYSPEMTEKVYAALCGEAGRALAAGHGVIVDAVSARERERDAIAAVARAAGVPFVGFWLEAPHETLAARIAARRSVARRAPSHERDASDATVDVLRRQLTFDLGRLDWVRLDAAADPQACLAEARRRLSGLDLE
ncbi:AAA family ATPase [Virgifigura deserti]|uniref:bifunctional aminoglycoside phosphotransferase/ATP-binding protein n=1 Tax=Virgifigura deserti TaxID=2268457 RepID=UPI003CCBD841